jgi:hypothetical protein
VYAILLAPASNRVYAGEAPALVAAELSVLLEAAGRDPGRIEPLDLAGVRYLSLDVAPDEVTERELGRGSAVLAVYEQVGDLLRPVVARRPDHFDDDLVTIPKYPGKTNEQFTRLLVNVTLAAQGRSRTGPASVLDPMSGRGTTLSTAWMLGHHAYGVEADQKAVDAQATFLRTYLRRKRIKHRVTSTPVRRDGRHLGRRLDGEALPPDGSHQLELTVFTGDTLDSATLFGKKRFDAVVTDAPYGIVHGSATRDPKTGKRGRRRSAAELLAEAIPVWASQLKPGGSLGLSWNTYGMRREQLAEIARGAGLEPMTEGPWLGFGHRVDSSIHRDVFVARA